MINLLNLKLYQELVPAVYASISCRIWEAETGGSRHHRELKSCLGNMARVKQNTYLEKLLYRHKNWCRALPVERWLWIGRARLAYGLWAGDAGQWDDSPCCERYPNGPCVTITKHLRDLLRWLLCHVLLEGPASLVWCQRYSKRGWGSLLISWWLESKGKTEAGVPLTPLRSLPPNGPASFHNVPLPPNKAAISD